MFYRLAYYLLEQYQSSAICFGFALKHLKKEDLTKWQVQLDSMLTIVHEQQNQDTSSLIPDECPNIPELEAAKIEGDEEFLNMSLKAPEGQIEKNEEKLSNRIRYDWSQTSFSLNIDIYAKKVKDEDVSLLMEKNTLKIEIKLEDGSIFSLVLDPLYEEIVPEKSSFKLFSSKVEITLIKKVSEIKWEALVKSPANNSVNVYAKDSNHSSASGNTKNKAKDWDSLAKLADLEEDEPTGEAALANLFQNLYKNADDDTRRAMMKSYTESNGTALSTNWKDVKSKTFETKPPQGMEPKKF